MKKCDSEYHEYFPHYGPAPHNHDLSGGDFIGSTRLKPKSEWPRNFTEDPEVPGCGTYVCPYCLEAKVQADEGDGK
jgi:hypothetical protein